MAKISEILLKWHVQFNDKKGKNGRRSYHKCRCVNDSSCLPPADTRKRDEKHDDAGNNPSDRGCSRGLQVHLILPSTSDINNQINLQSHNQPWCIPVETSISQIISPARMLLNPPRRYGWEMGEREGMADDVTTPGITLLVSFILR